MSNPSNGTPGGQPGAAANAHPSANGNGHVNGKPHVLDGLLGDVGSVLIVCVDPGLAAKMRESGIPAVCEVDEHKALQAAAARRNAIVVHMGPKNQVNAIQAASRIRDHYHPEHTLKLDMAELGFLDGSVETFDVWMDAESKKPGGIKDRDNFLDECLRRAKPHGPHPAGFDIGGERREPAKVTCMADVERKDVEWLWDQHVPLGMLTLLAGDPKIGKSFLTIALASAVSRGTCDLLPGGGMEGPGSVVLLSAEDDPARTIRPRLEAAGANLEKIHVYEATIGQDGSEMHPSLRVDLETIERVIRGLPDCKLLVIDPISAYLGGTDDHRNAELRGVLSPLKAMVERLGIGCVLVTHLNKSSGGNSKHRVQGSIAYVGACRANFLAIKDPHDETGRRVLICDSGTNITGEIPTLAYTIDPGLHGPVLTFDAGSIEITANEALAAEAEAVQQIRSSKQSPERGLAKSWLVEILSAGAWPAKEVEIAAREVGFTPKVLRNAREDLNVVISRSGFGRDSVSYWSLPDDNVQ